jgi:hypothetical protein
MVVASRQLPHLVEQGDYVLHRDRVHARRRLEVGQPQFLVPDVFLYVRERDLELGSAVRRGRGKQIGRPAFERCGELIDGRQPRFPVAVFQLREVGRRAAHGLTEGVKGQTRSLAEVPQPLTKYERIKRFSGHFREKFLISSLKTQDLERFIGQICGYMEKLSKCP